MSYVEKNLIGGETVVYTTRLHWIVLIWPIVMGLLFILPGLALLARSFTGAGDKSGTSTPMLLGGLILLVVGGACIGTGLLQRNAPEMAVTDRRVAATVGVATRRTGAV